MVAGEGLEHLFAAAVDEAALEIPGRVWHAADVVILVAPLGGVVDHQMAVRRPPLHAVFERQVVFRQLLAADQRAVGHPAAVGRRFGAQQMFADARIDAVGADHDVGMGRGAVDEVQHHLVTAIFNLAQAFAEVQGAGLQRGKLQRLQIAAVHRHIGGAVLPAGKAAQFDARQVVAAFGVAAEPEIGMRRHLLQPLLNTEPAENLQYVRPHVNAGAEARERRALFIQIDGKAGFLQQPGGGGAPQPGADDGDAWLFAHHVSPVCWLFSA